MSSWVDGHGQEQSEIECTCSRQSNCHASTSRTVCNCDATPYVQDWLQDTVNITDKQKLPITGFRYGFLRGLGNITISPLFCKGGQDPVDIE